ncbi:uncharacterized protein DS421_11g330830 [Arachis hypogaea]|nr:uncharacterized protein DS421_11g330830 [Arachis hypogaea]
MNPIMDPSIPFFLHPGEHPEPDEELFSTGQGNVSITSYFTKLKRIWEELQSFSPIPSCVCTLSCIELYKEKDDPSIS